MDIDGLVTDGGSVYVLAAGTAVRAPSMERTSRDAPGFVSRYKSTSDASTFSFLTRRAITFCDEAFVQYHACQPQRDTLPFLYLPQALPSHRLVAVPSSTQPLFRHHNGMLGSRQACDGLRMDPDFPGQKNTSLIGFIGVEDCRPHRPGPPGGMPATRSALAGTP